MSFRIDDILKKDPVNSDSNFSKSNNYPLTSNYSSLLQKTLLSKHNHLYYRPISVPNTKPAGGVNWCDHSDKFYPSQNYDFYRTKDMPYPSSYMRNQLWPNYTSIPVHFFPQFYHFSKRKGGQVRFSANQTEILEKRFMSHKYLSPEDRRLLADSLKLTDRQVKTWFQNRRAKWRRSQHNEIILENDENEKKNYPLHAYKKTEIK